MPLENKRPFPMPRWPLLQSASRAGQNPGRQQEGQGQPAGGRDSIAWFTTSSRRRAVRAVLWTCLVLGLCPTLPAQEFLTGRSLEEALDRPLSVAWTGLTRREALQRLSSGRGVALLLDRRIDPSIEISVEPSESSLREVLEALLPAPAGPRLLGDAVYLGPGPAIRRLRTAESLRADELRGLQAPATRLLDLGRRLTLQWEDLETPRGILKSIAERWNIRIGGLNQVPHDLWAGATLPNVSLSEAVSLVGIQFDLTFTWEQDGSRITLVPLPAVMTVERRHRIPIGAMASKTLAEWKAAFPEIEAHPDGRDIVVTGTLEEHEGIENLLRPDPRARPVKTAGPPPLDRVRAPRVAWDNPVRTLLDTLSKDANLQLDFEYDEQELKSAGIDLDQRIRFEVRNATAEDILHAAFDPLDIEFTLRDRTVTLKPRKSK